MKRKKKSLLHSIFCKNKFDTLTPAEQLNELRETFQIDEETLDKYIPEIFCCSIGFEIMSDPVQLPMENKLILVERANIEKSLARKKQNPYTRDELSVEELIPRTDIKNNIRRFVTSLAAELDRQQDPITALTITFNKFTPTNNLETHERSLNMSKNNFLRQVKSKNHIVVSDILDSYQPISISMVTSSALQLLKTIIVLSVSVLLPGIIIRATDLQRLSECKYREVKGPCVVSFWSPEMLCLISIFASATYCVFGLLSITDSIRNQHILCSTNSKGRNALHIAVANDDLKMLQILLLAQQRLSFRLLNNSLLFNTDNDRNNLFHIAALNGSQNVLQSLSDAGVSVMANNRRGKTPVALASLEGKNEITQFLAKKNLIEYLADQKRKINRKMNIIAPESIDTPRHFSFSCNIPMLEKYSAALLLQTYIDADDKFINGIKDRMVRENRLSPICSGVLRKTTMILAPELYNLNQARVTRATSRNQPSLH